MKINIIGFFRSLSLPSTSPNFDENSKHGQRTLIIDDISLSIAGQLSISFAVCYSNWNRNHLSIQKNIRHKETK